jgi:hypothetical protein
LRLSEATEGPELQGGGGRWRVLQGEVLRAAGGKLPTTRAGGYETQPRGTDGARVRQTWAGRANKNNDNVLKPSTKK